VIPHNNKLLAFFKPPLWWRYFFIRFGFFVASLSFIAFILFVFTDAVAHIKDIFDPTTSWHALESYYLCMLSIRLGVILPFALATATAILIPRIVKRNELIPLQNAGISLQRIAWPFCTVALLSSFLLWGNAEYILPTAMSQYIKITDSDFGRKQTREDPARLGVIHFEDGSRLFFSKHDGAKKQIDDAFWVRSPDCVFHIEQLLYYRDRCPEGHGVDIIERAPSGRMHKTSSLPLCRLQQLKVTHGTIRMAMSDPRTLSLSNLRQLVSCLHSSHSERAIETSVAFYSQLLHPLLALLAVLIPAPLCFRFERQYPQAIIVFVSLAALFCFLLVVHASVILARIPGAHPAPILILPWAAALLLGLRRAYGTI
jgi:lipopolysaccharide export LptBFGC system permease protein LptF